MTTMSTDERVEAAALQILEMSGRLPDPSEVAMALTEEDVVNGEYDGCSAELDMAASEYMASAERVL